MTSSQKELKIKAGVIGWPIKHSRSPLIHGHWLNQYAINGSYEKIAVDPNDLENFIKTLRDNFAGINITVPHKEKVFHFADIITKEAKAIGAANTIWFENEKLVAGNTDAYGFITHLTTSAPNWNANQPVMILGAGGASRAIIYALLQKNIPQILLTNRTTARAESLAKEFGPKVKVICWDEKENHLATCGLLVNTTSLGMTGSEPLQLKLDNLQESAICYDIVYAPLETELLKNARAKGANAIDGLGMLLHQAVPGFEKWFGQRPTVTSELRDLIIADLQKG